MIKPAEIKFDQFGQWWHPELDQEDNDEVPLQEIPQLVGMAWHVERIWPEDLPESAGFDPERPFDFRKWTPAPPEGPAWFPAAYAEDEDGPFAVFVRPQEVNNG